MFQKNPWLLPDGVEEVLPNDALHLERLRTAQLDLFKSWGYEQVITPLIDYLDSLLTGSGHDLDLQTFKLTDQLSGEMLGIRADMTPQVARIDAHNLRHEWPTRLCYVGTVLHTCGDPLEKTRSPMQIGAELFGHQGIDSDLEIIFLMLDMLATAELQNIHLDLGHVGIFRGLSLRAGLDHEQEAALFDVLQRKSKAELVDLVNSFTVAEDLKSGFLALADLHGGTEVLSRARELLSGSGQEVISALDDLVHLAEKLEKRYPSLPVSFDLAELRGYHYHTGVVFAAFIPSVGREIARGGRYDNIGSIFGRARPATGFSADLKLLSGLTNQKDAADAEEKIFAPADEDHLLVEIIRDLRANRRTVIQQLPGQLGNGLDMGCTSILKKSEQGWIVAPL